MKSKIFVLIAMAFALTATAQVNENVNYTIESTLLRPQVLEVGGARKDDKSNVNLWEWVGASQQKWQFIKAADGFWFIKMKIQVKSLTLKMAMTNLVVLFINTHLIIRLHNVLN